jgi:hypothetical protein
MISDETKSVIERSKRIYEQHKSHWDTEQRDRYVAIEPESGDFFSGTRLTKQSALREQNIREGCPTRSRSVTRRHFILG